MFRGLRIWAQYYYYNTNRMWKGGREGRGWGWWKVFHLHISEIACRNFAPMKVFSSSCMTFYSFVPRGLRACAVRYYLSIWHCHHHAI